MAKYQAVYLLLNNKSDLFECIVERTYVMIFSITSFSLVMPLTIDCRIVVKNGRKDGELTQKHQERTMDLLSRRSIDQEAELRRHH